ncbi:hypothetical protein EIMP300_38830 [Escherichia coli]|uniref:Alpha-ketoglutarate-dependent dioxygenase (Alkylated DNA repair protein) n=1 Tax=Escherichia coli TaxID=562 RepID=A0A8S0FPN4_ECOLX|nr:hypothetical protein EIMP300_38830 [Escherichia coli]
MLDLFADAEPWQEPLAAGAVILHRFAFNAAEQLIRDINDVGQPVAVSPDGHSRRIYHVGGDDQLWASGLDDPSARLSLFAH